MIELSGISIVSAFGAGLISFLSPCVLPLVPGYLSYIGGQSLDEMRDQGPSSKETLVIIGLSLCFVLGFSTVFIAFGASATALGQLLISYRYEMNIVGGIIIIIFGLFMTGLLKLNLFQREFRIHSELPGGKALSSYLLGLAFAFGWTPCIGPILGAILTISATSGLISSGTALLAIYSLGLGIPFILAALFTDQFLHHARRFRRHGPLLHRIAGVMLIIMGVAMVTGYLNRLSIWLLQNLTWFSNLG
ncbi:cytochrome c biogenesis CcdA family protein [Sedimenticola sp.]|uniref:cytochrome c biogenesis CcdA family protein n=1 Tax=Sedimenticola sp. TaxID=1940285 RepID=UPI003D0C7779